MFQGTSACGQEDGSQIGFNTNVKSTIVIEYGQLKLILKDFFNK